mgnify:CR=1 FL=1
MLKLPKKIKNIELLVKGKRSIVYTGSYEGKKITIKTKNPKSSAIGRMENESNYLKLLNKYDIGPTLIKNGKNFLIYEFVEGEQYSKLIGKINKKTKIELTLKILKQCRILMN